MYNMLGYPNLLCKWRRIG